MSHICTPTYRYLVIHHGELCPSPHRRISNVCRIHSSKITIQRGIVRQHEGPVKTTNSERPMAVDPEMLEVLKRWKQTTQFSNDEDWMFASPVQLARLP